MRELNIRQSRPTSNWKVVKCLPISRNVVVNDIYSIHSPNKNLYKCLIRFKNGHGERTIKPKPVEDMSSILCLIQCFIRVAKVFRTYDKDRN